MDYLLVILFARIGKGEQRVHNWKWGESMRSKWRVRNGIGWGHWAHANAINQIFNFLQTQPYVACTQRRKMLQKTAAATKGLQQMKYIWMLNCSALSSFHISSCALMIRGKHIDFLLEWKKRPARSFVIESWPEFILMLRSTMMPFRIPNKLNNSTSSFPAFLPGPCCKNTEEKYTSQSKKLISLDKLLCSAQHRFFFLPSPSSPESGGKTFYAIWNMNNSLLVSPAFYFSIKRSSEIK